LDFFILKYAHWGRDEMKYSFAGAQNEFEINLNTLCDLRVLCGEVLLENGTGFHEVSYKWFGVQINLK